MLRAIVCGLIITACSVEPTSNLNNLSANAKAKNIAVLFGGPAEIQNPPSKMDKKTTSSFQNTINKDLQRMSEMLTDLGFEVHQKPLATKEEIISMSAKHAADVGSDGTLFWYFSGHGSAGDKKSGREKGCLETVDGCLTFEPVAAAIKAARTTPIKRFLFVSYSCFSGQFVNGNLAILNKYRDLFSQVFVMSSSTAEQTSMSIGFTDAVVATVAEIKKDKPNATLRYFAEGVRQKTIKRFGGREIVQYGGDETVLEDTFLTRDMTQPVVTASDSYNKKYWLKICNTSKQAMYFATAKKSDGKFELIATNRVRGEGECAGVAFSPLDPALYLVVPNKFFQTAGLSQPKFESELPGFCFDNSSFRFLKNGVGGCDLENSFPNTVAYKIHLAPGDLRADFEYDADLLDEAGPAM